MEWTRGPAIGRGSSATVYLATTVSSGELFAVKSAELSSSVFLKNEQALLSNLNSTYIVKCLGSDLTIENHNTVFNLHMEYIPGGSLWDAIQRNGGGMDEPLIKSYLWQILRGLAYLHANRLAHCDIKSRNILLGKDGLKISDLGCAKIVGRVAGNCSISGTPAFMAPEAARGEEQGFEADIWAVGCTAIEMATGNHPWQEILDPISALYRIGFSGETPEIPRWLSEKARDLLSKCLINDLKDRWTAQELLEHPFFQDMKFDSELSEKECKNTTISPSCVLDKSFWDSMEEEEEESATPLNLTHQSSGFNHSPSERIERLTQIALSSPEAPNWDLDDDDDRDWVTVRSNGNMGSFDILEDTLMADEPVSQNPATDLEDELEFSSEFEENLMFLNLPNDFTVGRRFESLLEDFVLKTVKFELANEHFALLQISPWFFAIFFFFSFQSYSCPIHFCSINKFLFFHFYYMSKCDDFILLKIK